MNHNFKNLVFEGGGVKGIAYGGALEVLDQMNILPNIARVAGTSAGAINATLLSLGYTSQEVSEIIASTNFRDFEDKAIFPANFYGILKKYGWFKGNMFKDWIGQLIKDKTGSSSFTFGDLEDSVKSNPDHKLLYLVATNLNLQKAEIFSHEKTPSIPIREATRMSMSIPLYYRSVKKFDYIMVDGGVAYNYPVNLFDHVKYLANEQNVGPNTPDKDGFVYNYETLGFRLDSSETIQYNRDDWENVPVEINNIKDYALGVVNFMMEMANKGHLKEEDWNRTIFIDTGDIKTTDFDLTPNQVNTLIQSGKICTDKYFHWRDADPEWNMYPK